MLSVLVCFDIDIGYSRTPIQEAASMHHIDPHAQSHDHNVKLVSATKKVLVATTLLPYLDGCSRTLEGVYIPFSYVSCFHHYNRSYCQHSLTEVAAVEGFEHDCHGMYTMILGIDARHIIHIVHWFCLWPGILASGWRRLKPSSITPSMPRQDKTLSYERSSTSSATFYTTQSHLFLFLMDLNSWLSNTTSL